MNEDFSQPFYVGINNKRFKYRSSDGYLPALEPRIEALPPQEVVVVHRNSSMTQQEHDTLEQLVQRVAWLQKKLLEKEKKAQGNDNFEPF
mgnify:CR=1 FL=1